ncbi:MAG: phytanoyl-CoA dioxygenase family protein [Pseudomonadales bacterium]
MLSPQDIAHYQSEGYVIPDFALPESIIEGIRRDHARLLEAHPEFGDYCAAVLAFDLGFLNYARNPEILDMVEQLIGPDIALWNSSFFAKPAREGKRTPMHQDGAYWPIRPMATCTVWIAVDEASSENGCLQVIPGSHQLGEIRPHENDPSDDVNLHLEIRREEYDASRAVDITLNVGQVSLHDAFLVHGSAANRSDQPRRGMTLRFMPTTSVYRRDLATQAPGRLSMAERSLFLMRGVDRSGRNDFRIRF